MKLLSFSLIVTYKEEIGKFSDGGLIYQVAGLFSFLFLWWYNDKRNIVVYLRTNLKKQEGI